MVQFPRTALEQMKTKDCQGKKHLEIMVLSCAVVGVWGRGREVVENGMREGLECSEMKSFYSATSYFRNIS